MLKFDTENIRQVLAEIRLVFFFIGIICTCHNIVFQSNSSLINRVVYCRCMHNSATHSLPETASNVDTDFQCCLRLIDECTTFTCRRSKLHTVSPKKSEPTVARSSFEKQKLISITFWWKKTARFQKSNSCSVISESRSLFLILCNLIGDDESDLSILLSCRAGEKERAASAGNGFCRSESVAV